MSCISPLRRGLAFYTARYLNLHVNLCISTQESVLAKYGTAYTGEVYVGECVLGMNAGGQ